MHVSDACETQFADHEFLAVDHFGSNVRGCARSAALNCLSSSQIFHCMNQARMADLLGAVQIELGSKQHRL